MNKNTTYDLESDIKELFNSETLRDGNTSQTGFFFMLSQKQYHGIITE